MEGQVLSRPGDAASQQGLVSSPHTTQTERPQQRERRRALSAAGISAPQAWQDNSLVTLTPGLPHSLASCQLGGGGREC